MRRILNLVPVKVLRNLNYTLICSRLTYAITAWESVFNSTTLRLKSLTSKAISLIEDQTHTNQLQMGPKFIQLEGVYDYLLCAICLELFVNKNMFPLLKN